MVGITRSSGERGFDGGTFEAIGRATLAAERSAARIDTALLVSPLFLSRFTLPFRNTFLHLDLLILSSILIYQFIRGNIVIQYDRFLWFLCVGMMIGVSLLLNFNSNMLTGCVDLIFTYFLFTLSRSSSPEQYKQTLHGFQFLVALLASIGIVQFAAQFVVDGNQLVNFYGLIPSFLFDDPAVGMHDPRLASNGLIEATGLFFPEPSFLSQFTALGMLIEILEFRRPRYLLVMALGLLLSYSGTGLMLLLLFLPLSVQRSKAAAGAMAFVAILVIGLAATGIIDLSNFTSRVNEFHQINSSGFDRFVAPFWEASVVVASGDVRSLLLGHGPGTLKTTYSLTFFLGTDTIWFKMFYEYGIIGSFIFVCFLLSCVKGTRCAGIVSAAIMISYVFLGGGMVLAMIPLCTLNGLPESRRRPFGSPGGIPEIAGDDRRESNASGRDHRRGFMGTVAKSSSQRDLPSST